jgi:UDP-N-acetylglucosamine acyltransferase
MMMPKNKQELEIHPTAIVHPSAKIGEGVRLGPYVIINEGASIGDHTSIGAHAVIDQGTQIGRHCQIYPQAILGSAPQSVKYKGEKTFLKIGDHTVIREFTTISRGTPEGGKETVIGDNCFIMAYAHIGHDCRLGKEVIMANAATLGGHVTIEDYAIVGGLTPVHQFARIGAYAMVGGGSGVGKDIVPYAMASGNRAKIYGLNIIGLKRHGFSSETIKKLRQAYNLIFFSQFNTAQALEAIEDQIKGCPEVDYLVKFIRGSQRGICKKIEQDEG